jgi:hypothetical protein
VRLRRALFLIKGVGGGAGGRPRPRTRTAQSPARHPTCSRGALLAATPPLPDARARRSFLADMLASVVTYIKDPPAVRAAAGPAQAPAVVAASASSAAAAAPASVQLVQLPPPPPSGGIVLDTETPGEHSRWRADPRIGQCTPTLRSAPRVPPAAHAGLLERL